MRYTNRLLLPLLLLYSAKKTHNIIICYAAVIIA